MDLLTNIFIFLFLTVIIGFITIVIYEFIKEVK